MVFLQQKTHSQFTFFLFIGGLAGSSLIARGLITQYVPFLPLEKKHVRECVFDNLREKGYGSHSRQWLDEIAEKVIGDLIFEPDKLKLYSTGGCKAVNAKVNYHLED